MAKPIKKSISYESRVCIDITNDSVRVVKLNSSGVIIRSAIADLEQAYETLPVEPDAQYIRHLSSAIRSAAKKSKIASIQQQPCVAVTGGSCIIIQRFEWPELPREAMYPHMCREMETYLPEDIINYVLSYEVQRRTKKDKMSTVDVIVCAIPKGASHNIMTAIKKAGFKPTRLDVRECVRGNVVAQCSSDLEENLSFAILDATQKQINLTLYSNGLYYSSRYITSQAGNIIEGQPQEETRPSGTETFRNSSDTLLDNDILNGLDPGSRGRLSRMLSDVSAEVSPYDVDMLIEEVVSIIDYMDYQERGSRMDYILLLGEERLPGIIAGLQGATQIRIKSSFEWLKSGITRDRNMYLPFLIDAYATSFPTPLSVNKQRMNLLPPVLPSKAKKAILPVLISIAAASVLAVFGIIFPLREVHELERRVAWLQMEYDMFPITPARLAEAQRYLPILTEQIQLTDHFRWNFIILAEMYDEFFTQWPQARQIIPVIHQYPDLLIHDFEARAGLIQMEGVVEDFTQVANFIDFLRDHDLVEWVFYEVAEMDLEEEVPDYATTFDITIALRRGAGER